MDARTRILEAAIDCFCDYGFHQTTTRKIAETAKLSNGLINYHFPDTKAIFWEAIDYIYKKITPEIRAQVDASYGLEKIRKVIEANFKVCIEKYPKYYSCIVISYYIAPYDKKMSLLHRQLYQSSVTKVEEIISAYYLSRRKKKAPKKEARMLALSIWHEMEGGLLFASVLNDKEYKKWLPAQLLILEDKIKNWVGRK